ncbi:MAG: sulfatase-like hydrolase/transferase [Candidatus Nealsonbacteria bacterium]|nr:sulfatase-like hydrolase/transferase [Candidatus Nealsonbacteria bacterium]
MRRILISISLMICTTGAAPAPADGASPSDGADGKRPNVVIFVADDLGWNDVGYHGSEIRTPHIDKLAADGLELDRFYSFPICSPTRAALMTGRSPMRFGINGPLQPGAAGLPLDEHLLPETFRAAGYQTWIVGKWHLGSSDEQRLPHRRGFDHFYGFIGGGVDYFAHTEFRTGEQDWQRNGKRFTEEGYSTDLFADEAVRLLHARDKRKPAFLYLSFNAPHSPLQAPQPLIDKYTSIASPHRRVYAAMVDAMDAAIGRVLTAIDEEGMKDNTLVLFFSDNGGQSGRGMAAAASNEPLLRGKGSVCEGGIRVPAAVRFPGVLPAGRTSRQVVSVLDLLPTLAAAAGITPGNTEPLDGRNLWPAIRDDKRVPPEDLLVGNRRDYALLHGRWKLIQSGAAAGEVQQNWLIDLEQDPHEKRNVAAEHPQVVRELSARIALWTLSIGLQQGPGTRPPRPGRPRSQ